MVYRDGPRPKAPRGRPEPGLVTEMVQQFADPYAFLRELVQNGLDAGATRLDVSVELGLDGVLRTSVTDDGCGMTPAVMQTALCTLFSSTKEGDESKVGKYGVGFVSVFAIEPDRVLVESSRDGQVALLSLETDHSYTIEALEPRAASGTRVTLVHDNGAARFDQHHAAAEASLLRWCRHASIPIELYITDARSAEEPRRVRIDRPLDIFAELWVKDESDDLSLIVGYAAGSEYLNSSGVFAAERAPSFAGFYNRGLTLYESSSEQFPGLEKLRFKLASSRFAHTLSRDNVRRDKHFDRALKHLQRVVEGPLEEALVRELRAAAESAGAGENPRRYVALLAAARAAELSAKQICFPLTDPYQGKLALSADELAGESGEGGALLGSHLRDSLSAALTRAGQPVAYCPARAVASALGEVAEASRWLKRSVYDTHTTYTLLEESVARGPHDQALLDALVAGLAAIDARVGAIGVCTVHGALGDQNAFLIDQAGPRLFPAAKLSSGRKRLARDNLLLLNSRGQALGHARRAAAKDPRTAAGLLLRVLLLELAGPVSEQENERLLASVLGALP